MIRTLLVAAPALAAACIAPPASASETGVLGMLLQMPLAGQPGSHSGGSLMGTFTGDVNGTIVNGASVSGSFTYEASAFPCPAVTVATGSITIAGAGTMDFAYRRDGVYFAMSISDGSQAYGVARLAGGVPCNASQPAQVEAADGVILGP